MAKGHKIYFTSTRTAVLVHLRFLIILFLLSTTTFFELTVNTPCFFLSISAFFQLSCIVFTFYSTITFSFLYLCSIDFTFWSHIFWNFKHCFYFLYILYCRSFILSSINCIVSVFHHLHLRFFMHKHGSHKIHVPICAQWIPIPWISWFKVAINMVAKPRDCLCGMILSLGGHHLSTPLAWMCCTKN